VQGPLEPVYRAALALGTANQLTNILRDVGEDIRERDRIYVPLDDLGKFNISEDELVSGMHCSSTGKIDDRYVQFMKYMVRCCSTLPVHLVQLACFSCPANQTQPPDVAPLDLHLAGLVLWLVHPWPDASQASLCAFEPNHVFLKNVADASGR
jgi:hypothetical protein